MGISVLSSLSNQGSMFFSSFAMVTISPAEVGMNLEIFYKVFFSTDIDSLECPLSESAGWTSVTLEHFEKFKMASKMAAILGFRL